MKFISSALLVLFASVSQAQAFVVPSTSPSFGLLSSKLAAAMAEDEDVEADGGSQYLVSSFFRMPEIENAN
jgi:hypothetical protein